MEGKSIARQLLEIWLTATEEDLAEFDDYVEVAELARNSLSARTNGGEPPRRPRGRPRKVVTLAPDTPETVAAAEA